MKKADLITFKKVDHHGGPLMRWSKSRKVVITPDLKAALLAAMVQGVARMVQRTVPVPRQRVRVVLVLATRWVPRTSNLVRW